MKNSGVVDRLTDTAKYTGSHKERFDETGKGKGLEGRDTVVKGSGMTAGCVAGQPGYVSGYKNEGTHKLASSSSNPVSVYYYSLLQLKRCATITMRASLRLRIAFLEIFSCYCFCPNLLTLLYCN